MRCPCKDCKDRVVNCHAESEMHTKKATKFIRKWEF